MIYNINSCPTYHAVEKSLEQRIRQNTAVIEGRERVKEVEYNSQADGKRIWDSESNWKAMP
jgi:hypothetical protein